MLKKNFPYILIFFLGTVVYLPSFQVPFSLDDYPIIVFNSQIKTLQNLPALFSFDPTRFVTHLTLAINYRLDGFDVLNYHRFNLIVHGINAVLCFWLVALTLYLPKIRRLTFKFAEFIPLFCALIFLLHPIQTQAVTYIVQRSTLLASLFYLSALILYIKMRLDFQWKYFGWSLAVVVLGSMSKPIFITLPLMIAFYEWFGFERPKNYFKKNFYLYIPYGLLVAAIPLFLLAYMLNHFGETFDWARMEYATRVSGEISRWEYFLTQWRVVMTYLRLLIWPLEQSFDYDYPLSPGIWHGPTLLSLLGLLAIGFIFVRFRKKAWWVSFAIGFMAITLLLESSIFPLPDVIFEHRLYLAVIGFGFLVCAVLGHLIKDKRVYVVCLSLLILNYSFLTYARNLIWLDQIGLVNDSLKKAPQKSRLYLLLGWLYHRQGLAALAEENYKKAIGLKDHASIRENLAALYAAEKKYPEAAEELKAALRLNAGRLDLEMRLGDLYFLMGRYEAAFAQFRKIAVAWPEGPFSFKRLADCYLQMGQIEEAERFYKQAALRDSRSPFFAMTLGNFYYSQNMFDKAIEVYNGITQTHPAYEESAMMLGYSWMKLKDPPKAYEYFDRAFKMNPRNPKVHQGMAYYYRQTGQKQRAAEYEFELPGERATGYNGRRLKP